jgi:predicted GNAT family N-acyltransferase
LDRESQQESIRLGTWAELGALALPLRVAVFVREQNVPPELEHDQDDSLATHAVLVRVGHGVIATGRLLSSGKIGRLAVAREFRRQGFGRQVLQRLMAHAFELGHTQVWLHAQCEARSFYEALGFEAGGAIFEEAGIDHIRMSRTNPSAHGFGQL